MGGEVYVGHIALTVPVPVAGRIGLPDTGIILPWSEEPFFWCDPPLQLLDFGDHIHACISGLLRSVLLLSNPSGKVGLCLNSTGFSIVEGVEACPG